MASTPPFKDLDQKQVLSALMAHISPTPMEEFEETMAAQTSGEGPNTLLGAPDSAIRQFSRTYG